MYEWAANKFKLERAIKEVRGDSDLTQTIGTNPITEEAVKAVYIRLAGKVIEEQPEVVEEAPKKKGRKAK